MGALSTVFATPAARLPVADRWVGVGRAAGTAPEAGSAALHEALAGRSAAQAKLVIVFASSDLDLATVVAGISKIAAGAPVVGCTTAGEIAAAGPSDRSIVVTVLGGRDFSVAASCATGAGADLRGAGATVASAITRLDDRPHQMLLLLTDGLAGDQQEIVRGAYGVVGAQVPLVGGCAGDDLRMQSTSVFFGGNVLSDAVVGVAIGSSGPFGIGVSHGWRRVGEPMLVTASTATRVLTLDDEPALDSYLRRLGAPAEVAADPAAFTRFAMTHPLGMNRRSGEEVRFIAGADFAERSLQCIAHAPPGGLAWIMEGDDESVLTATRAACTAALDQLGDAEPKGVIVFDCIARRGVLGDVGITDEVRQLADAVPGTPLAGFYSYGEIARTKGTGGFHNQTLVVLAVS
jgi:hypothetical protein